MLHSQAGDDLVGQTAVGVGKNIQPGSGGQTEVHGRHQTMVLPGASGLEVAERRTSVLNGLEERRAGKRNDRLAKDTGGDRENDELSM